MAVKDRSISAAVQTVLKMCTDQLFVLGLFLLLFGQKSSSQTCPRFGTDGQGLSGSENRFRDDRRLFLNFESPAQCNGTVTSWRYCYYYDDDDDNIEDHANSQQYGAKFLVYRRSDSSDSYQPVANSTKLVSVTKSDLNFNSVTCLTVTLAANEQFQIQTNDIIAACVIDNNPYRELRIIRRNSDQDSYQYNRMGYEDCTTQQLQTVDTQLRDFRVRSRYGLLLYVNINSLSTQCSAGSNPPPFSPSTTSGTYLNTAEPVQCTDTITVWHYCYYPSSASNTQTTYTAVIGVWRMNTQYELVTGSNYTLRLQPESTQLAKVVCKSVRLQEGEYVRVNQNDVIGITIPTLNPIPLIASGASGYSLQSSTHSSQPTTLATSQLTEMSNMALHLYPDIVSQPATTTEQPTAAATTETTTSAPVTTEATSVGAIIGVVVALLLVLITTAVVVLAVLLVVRNKRKDSYSYSIKNDASNSNAIDNALYDESALARLEASTYEIPVSNQPEHDYSEASTELTHTYDYTSFDPYEDVANSQPPSVSIYDSPLDSNVVSFSALLQKNQQEDIYADLQPYRPPSIHNKDAIYGMIREFGIIDIPRLVIRSVGHLGSGQFANVEEGTWKKGVNKEVRVALKTMKPGSTEEDKIKFLQEAAIMAQFRHPNVVSLYGVVSKGDPVILVTELMEKGDLRHYLNSIRPDPGELPPADLPKLLLIFSQQIALGMQYLAGKGFVHRDLAARNILVSENKICKVSDFGMSRDLADETYYVAHGGKIPVKWTAPEALNYKKYSTASDVWSYGCLLYEIWSLGRKPFEGISNAEVIRLVESGRRLPPPPGCPKMIYQLMILCWNPATSPRPSFRDLILTLVGNQQLVLSIPQDAIQSHQLAGVLGAPVEAGEYMYQDLQYTYVNSNHGTGGNKLENDYEEFV